MVVPAVWVAMWFLFSFIWHDLPGVFQLAAFIGTLMAGVGAWAVVENFISDYRLPPKD